MTKRALDFFGASVGLLLLSPLFLLIAISVKLDSSGPVFFRQSRVGKAGVLFSIFKFRTMRDAPWEDGLRFTVQGDQRITRIGAILRRLKLDELPQLLNVLLGQMSLVGPRPEVPHYMSLYSESQRNVILSVKPGITDYAAIELRNEEGILASYPDRDKAYVEELMPRKFALYSRYVLEQSFLLDLKLIFRTIVLIAARHHRR